MNYNKIFSSFVKHMSICISLALVATMDMELEQLNKKTFFLHGKLEEEVLTKQPESFKVQGKENSSCRLKRSLYGLKQSPRQ